MAEYRAVIEGLKRADTLGVDESECVWTVRSL